MIQRTVFFGLLMGLLAACDPDPTALGPEPTALEAAGEGAHPGLEAATPSKCAGTTPSLPSSPKFRVYLLLGQSNMAGFPKAQSADKVEDPRIKVLGYDNCAATGRKQNQWDVAAPPLHECWNGAIGPGDSFARTMIEQLPQGDTIGLVPCAISGEKIETFLKRGGAKYAWIIQRAKLALDAGGHIEGILFHQGESNNGDPSWPEKVKTLVADLKADLGLGNIPFLAGELLYGGGAAGHNRLVNTLPSMIPNAHVVSARDLAADPTDARYRLHFGHDAQITLGKRYAATMMEATRTK